MNDFMVKDNEDCLLIYRKLLVAFERCAENASPYLNIIALFFHDIMRVLTGLAVCRNELEGPYAPPKDVRSLRTRSFPYIGYRDILDGINVDDKNYKVRYHGRAAFRKRLAHLKWEVISKVTSLSPGKSLHASKRLWANAGVIGHSRLAQAGFRADYRVPRHISIPNRSFQLRELRTTVDDICQSLDLHHHYRALAELLDRHILVKTRELDPPKKLPYDLVLTRTLLGLESRFMAALGRHSGIPVVGVCHGEGDGVFDEPAVGYGERTFPTFYVGYGGGGDLVPENEHYRKSLYEQPSYVSADSDFVRSQYNGKAVEPLKSLAGKTLMYVPSQFYGWRRYGPFHLLPDHLYLFWQEALFKEFPDLILKRHPKEFDDAKFTLQGATRVMHGRFEECLDQADIFVFDVLSGAAWNAVATSKPIIYFNIGLRNLTEMSAEALRRRCVWIDVDPARPTALREQVAVHLSDPKTNNFSSTFCLAQSDNALTREQSVLGVLDSAY